MALGPQRQGRARVQAHVLPSLESRQTRRRVHMADLHETAQALVAEGKGILAADESSGTIKKRFDSIGVESTEENRRAYRDLLFTTEGVEEYISGVILFDATIRQSSAGGSTYPARCSSRTWCFRATRRKTAQALTRSPTGRCGASTSTCPQRFPEWC